MSYTKELVTVTVKVHDGSEIVFADSVSDGKTYRYGTAVRSQLLLGGTVESIGTVSGGEATKYIIPYHSVVYATVETAASEALTPATDEFCVTE